MGFKTIAFNIWNERSFNLIKIPTIIFDASSDANDTKINSYNYMHGPLFRLNHLYFVHVQKIQKKKMKNKPAVSR